MEKLIVKNFAAIRNIEIQFKELTVFIGETGTGKSTLAKLVSIFRSTNFWEGDIRQLEFFKIRLAYYQIANFLESTTYIEYQSEKYAALDRKELIGLFPETLLDFTGTFNKVSSILRKLKIALFDDITYQKENGKDYIILPTGKSLLLSESASGLQAIIPALIVFDYFSQDTNKKSYTFEEPELNLFPVAQKSLVEFLA